MSGGGSFPDAGHLIILYLISALMYLFIFAFFSVMIAEIQRPIKGCITGGGNLSWNLFYWIALATYSGLIIAIYTLYLYSYWCSNYAISTIPIIHGILSAVFISVAVISYYYISRGYGINRLYGVMPFLERWDLKSRSTMIFTIVLAILSILLIINIALTGVNKWIFIYPAGLMIVGIISYYMFNGGHSRAYQYMMLGLIVIISFGTYATAFVMNSADLCV
jgi:hypothetical protein